MASCTKPLLLRLLASSVTVATRAGKIVRDVMSRGELGIVDKGVDDLQTEADRSAQRCIIASLLQQYPNLTIIGEESTNNLEVPSDWIVTELDKDVINNQCPKQYELIKNDDIVVWVDPLDGTKEYTQGLLDHVTVLIGLAVKGQAIGGVIHQPYYNYKQGGDLIGRTVWGMNGIGVGGGLTVQQPPIGKLIVTTTRSHSNPLNTKTIESLQPDEVIRVGGAGHKVLLLLEGKAHAFIFASVGTKKWDTCGPEAILTASGGKLTTIQGDFYQYDKDVNHPNDRGVIATANSVDHAQILSKIPQDVQNELK